MPKPLDRLVLPSEAYMSLPPRSDTLGLLERTRKNLEFLRVAAESGADVHPVTQLTNSLLVVIVFQKEKGVVNKLAKTRLAELPKPEWPKWKITFGTSNTLRELLDRLRNAISHGNITYSSDSRKLEEVEVGFSDLGKSGKDLKWSAEINGADLFKFCLSLIALIENTIG